jgi:hypothetical protein
LNESERSEGETPLPGCAVHLELDRKLVTKSNEERANPDENAASGNEGTE